MVDVWSRLERYDLQFTCEMSTKVTPVAKKITKKGLKLYEYVNGTC